MERTPAIAALFEQARQIGRRARPGADRGLDRRRQRRQLHRGARHPDPRRPGRARRRRPRRRRAHPGRLPPRTRGAALLACSCSTCSRNHDDNRAGRHGLTTEITIRRAETIADYRACQDAQRRAWGISDDGYLVPIATMVGANLHGGLVLGAFLPDGEAVAMSFAFLGRIEGRLCLYSQLTGVVPGYQSRGLGYRIKILQRAIARAEGIERIAWAFDPLQAGQRPLQPGPAGRNGRPLRRQHVRRRTDALNAGVPTDRLIAEWDTQGDPSKVRFADADRDAARSLIRQSEQGPTRARSGSAGAVSVLNRPAHPARDSRRHRQLRRSEARAGRAMACDSSARHFRPHSRPAIVRSISSATIRRAGAEAFTCSSDYNRATLYDEDITTITGAIHEPNPDRSITVRTTCATAGERSGCWRRWCSSGSWLWVSASSWTSRDRCCRTPSSPGASAR